MSRGQLAVWCAVVVVVGPVLNFVHDWRQDEPFYDHGPVAAMIIALALTSLVALLYLPALALALTLNPRPHRSPRTRLMLGLVFAACVWLSHLLGWVVVTFTDRSTVGVLVYPAGSLLAWLAVRRIDQGTCAP